MFSVEPLSQRDPRWSEIPLGFGAGQTIGEYGCTLTCLALVANGFGYHETPDTMNAKLKTLGNGVGFIGASILFAGPTLVLPDLVFKNFVRCRDFSAPLPDINAALDAGNPVVVEVDFSPIPGLQSHWVLLYDHQDGDYLVRDPWPVPAEGGDVLLTSRYGFAGAPEHIISTVVWYERKSEEVPAPPPAANLVIQVVDAISPKSLRLRTQPNLTADVIKLEPAGTELTVLDAADIAAPKVGVVDQWLHIRDQQAVEGYVAAWFVQRKNQA